PKDSQSKTGLFSFLGVGVSILLANLLRPLMDYFNIQITPLFTYSILLFAFFIIISIRKYLSKINKKSLCNIIEIENIKMEKIRIRPKSIKHFLKFIFGYLFILALNILSVALFIEFGNMMMLLFLMIFALVLFIFNIATVVPGRTKIKFVKC
ncbi:DUF443 family protein, partial [Virgibacillus halodenitrificans]|uniref:DUF443 family protein n=1 Tax=Virgibacillus halodenitrificans TaxID=1482 RepID=UPI00036A86FA